MPAWTLAQKTRASCILNNWSYLAWTTGGSNKWWHNLHQSNKCQDNHNTQFWRAIFVTAVPPNQLQPIGTAHNNNRSVLFKNNHWTESKVSLLIWRDLLSTVPLDTTCKPIRNGGAGAGAKLKTSGRNQKRITALTICLVVAIVLQKRKRSKYNSARLRYTRT